MACVNDVAVSDGERRRPDRAIVGLRLASAGGVAIGGVDLSRPLTAAARSRIGAAFLDHHIVVFPGQTLARERQFAFAANFGVVETHAPRGANHKRYTVAHVISNLDGAGNPIDRSASPVSNYNWHTDKPYYREPPMMTLLYAVEMPPSGGDTEFANMAMAYAALPEQTKQQIATLRVAFRWGAGSGLSRQLPNGGSEDEETVDHPLVRTHPETGHKALYLGNHASHILGLAAAEGRGLLNELLTHATQRRFVYTHRWHIGDLIMWDNRCLLHRAVANFAMDRYRRILHRTVVRGTVPF